MSELMIPPNSTQAEQSVLGGLMLDNTAWPKIQAVLQASDFYDQRHRILYKAIKHLLNNEKPADILTVDELIKDRGHEETVGGLAYIGLLAKDTPSSANIGHYAQIVRDKSMLRQILLLSASMGQWALAKDAVVKDTIAQIESEVFKLTESQFKGKKGFTRIQEIMKAVLDRIEDNAQRPNGGVLGVASGFTDLDYLTSGFNGGDLIIVAARPSMGKTTLAMNMAEASALAGRVVAVFSLEMTDSQLGERLLSANSGVSLKRIRESWTLEDGHWPKISDGLSRIANIPLWVDDSPGLSVTDIRSRCMRLNAEIRDEFPAGIGLIVIDYLQLMGGDKDRAGNRNNEIEDITRGLKRLAKEFNVPVMALSQLNRGSENRTNKRPLMADLRDSGGIEQDADLVLFVYRDEVYNKDSVDQGIAEVIIGKQRNGPLGTVKLQFDGSKVRFRDLAYGRT